MAADGGLVVEKGILRIDECRSDFAEASSYAEASADKTADKTADKMKDKMKD
jgi:hypothetical protein